MEAILFYCIICLHHFYLGFEDPALSQQREDTCNQCAKSLLTEPQFNSYANPDATEKISLEHQQTFDPHLLPIFQKVIEEKIQIACEMTEPFSGKVLFHGGLFLKDQVSWRMFHDFSDVLREVYLYGKDIKETLEKEKSSILKEIEQKVNDVTTVSKELKNIVEITERTDMGVDLDKASRNMKIAATMIRWKQRETEQEAARLAVKETIKTMEEYSKMVSVLYTHYTLVKKTDFMSEVWKIKSSFEESMKTLKEMLNYRRIPNFSVIFEKLLLEFNLTLQEISKKTDMFEANRYHYGVIEEKVKQSLNENNIQEDL